MNIMCHHEDKKAGPSWRHSSIARLMLAVAIIATLLPGLDIDRDRCCYRAGWLRVGVMRIPSFGADATSPGDPRDGSDYRYLIRGDWLAYAGIDRR
jgi:hypothetical protein